MVFCNFRLVVMNLLNVESKLYHQSNDIILTKVYEKHSHSLPKFNLVLFRYEKHSSGVTLCWETISLPDIKVYQRKNPVPGIEYLFSSCWSVSWVP